MPTIDHLYVVCLTGTTKDISYLIEITDVESKEILQRFEKNSFE